MLLRDFLCCSFVIPCLWRNLAMIAVIASLDDSQSIPPNFSGKKSNLSDCSLEPDGRNTKTLVIDTYCKPLASRWLAKFLDGNHLNFI